MLTELVARLFTTGKSLQRLILAANKQATFLKIPIERLWGYHNVWNFRQIRIRAVRN